MLDVGLGRSYFPLGPIEVQMAAPREVVFDVIQGAYSERAPAGVKSHIKVIERAGDLVVAEHRTPLRAPFPCGLCHPPGAGAACARDVRTAGA